MTVVDPSPQQDRPPAEVPDDEPVSLLAADGARRPDERWDGWLLDVDDAALRSLHRDLVLARRLDDVATALQRQGELGLWSPSRGQEAAQVGAGRALEEHDFAFPSYREHALALVRGVDPVGLLGLFRGTTLGGWDPAVHRFGLYTIVVGSQALHAVGWAMGVRLDGEDAAVLACFGDGATSQGDVHEACVWAASYTAPVVLLCQNNQWAISEPLERQTKVPLARRAVGYGMPGVRVDGDDVLAVLAVCRAALARARAGQGPTFVEAVTYRAGPHTTSDDPSRYRDPAEERVWAARDPLVRSERHLRQSGAADDEWFARLTAEADALADDVRRRVRALGDPPLERLGQHVLAPADDGGSADPQLRRALAQHVADLGAEQGEDV